MDDPWLISLLNWIKILSIGAAKLVFSGDLDRLLNSYSHYDAFADVVWNEDRRRFEPSQGYSIHTLQPFEPEDLQVAKEANLVLVLVEKRLLDDQIRILNQPRFDGFVASNEPYPRIQWSAQPPTPISLPPKPGDFDLRPCLRRLRGDINNTLCDFRWKGGPQNYTASIIKAAVYAGEQHRDGLTVLALRAFLRDVKEYYPNFRGLILVGAFPEAFIRRKCGPAGSASEVNLAQRSDLPLADLNGRWGPQLYHPVRYDKEYFLLDDSRPVVDGGVLHKKQVGGKAYNTWDAEVGDADLFGDAYDPAMGKYRAHGLLFRHALADAVRVFDQAESQVNKADIFEAAGKYYNAADQEYGTLYAEYPDRNMVLNEDGASNLENPIAFPDILVSRINARNVARSNRLVFFPGDTLLDPYLERELLIEYFDRDHMYRSGELKHRGCFAIACNHTDEDEYQPVDLRAAFAESQAAYRDIQHETAVPYWAFKNCTLDGFRQMLEQPALLRSMLMHGDFRSLELRDGHWDFHRWQDWRLTRKTAPGMAAFYWNTACFSNAPLYADFLSYNSHMYGFGMPAECLLFFGDGLAVISQAELRGSWPGKYPDATEEPSPPGGSFERTLRAGRTFGETWRAIYEEVRNNPTLAQTDTSAADEDTRRKDVYIWGIVGDWTLKFNP